jgi:hypothetical protein
MGDVQIRAAQDFIAEFGDMLAWSKTDLIRSPTDTLFHAPFRDGVEKANPTLYQAAINYREVVKNFLNVRSAAENQYLQSTQSSAQMLDGGIISAPWMIRAVRNPIQSIRSFIHHFFLMGPQQMWVQASGVSQIMAAEGIMQGTSRGYRAVPASIYSRWLFRAHPSDDMIEHAASKIGSMGWKREHFIEAYKGLRDTGFHNVGKEYAGIDDFAAATVLQTTGGKVLDYGLRPF